MDINNDELRRDLRDLDREHRDVMPRWRDSLMRLLVDDKETSTEDKADFLLGGFNRRRFISLLRGTPPYPRATSTSCTSCPGW